MLANYFNQAFIYKMSRYCNDDDIERVARIVYGEARGEPEKGQRAVAYTLLNRVNHPGYPNSLHDVMYSTSGGGRHQYETLDRSDHESSWREAKRQNNDEYRTAIRASRDALCGRKGDPTGGATDFATSESNPAVQDNEYYKATNKIWIGNHVFVSRKARR